MNTMIDTIASYIYDANGSLTRDNNKGITYEYDLLGHLKLEHTAEPSLLCYNAEGLQGVFWDMRTRDADAALAKACASNWKEIKQMKFSKWKLKRIFWNGSAQILFRTVSIDKSRAVSPIHPVYYYYH